MINNLENLKTYAHIFDGKVVNVSLWDSAPEDSSLVEIPKSIQAGIGWDYINEKFVDNRPVVQPSSNFIEETN
jgi:hypothetical protein